jgi:uncharacterized membrane protein
MEKLRNVTKSLFRNMPLVFGITILAMDIIAVLAPILAHFGFTTISHWIYFVYSFLCHQRPWRSIHLFDFQIAWCTRDLFIYLSMALSAFFVKAFKIRKVKWYAALLSILPFALDGTIQMIAEINGVLNDKEVFFYASTNLIRMLTGTIFGTGAGLWLFSLLDETIEEELEEEKSEILNTKFKTKTKSEERNPRAKLENLKYFLLIILICFISYLGLIQIWNVTSDKYKPSGILENVRYFPGYNYEVVGRGGHGV